MGILNLSHDELFALTPFQFQQLFDGWQERERRAAVKRAELEVVIINSNRWDEKQRTVEIGDILPWYDDYVSGREITRRPEYVEPREVDLDVPQLERVTKRLLEQKGLDPNEVKRDSPEWREAEKIATSCVTGGTGKVVEHAEGMAGFDYRKADPAEWGKPPWEDED